MRLYRADVNAVQNGCGPVAIAALTGKSPLEYVKSGQTRRGQFRGMTDKQVFSALTTTNLGRVVEQSFCTLGTRKPWLASALPLEGKGIVLVMKGSNRYHALAFDGKMVYDTHVPGRWQWVYDHIWSHSRVRLILTIHPEG